MSIFPLSQNILFERSRLAFPETLRTLNPVAEFCAQHKAQGKPEFETRIGIHTGPLVAGVVGINKFQFDI